MNIDSPVQYQFMDWGWYMGEYIHTDYFAGFLNLFSMKSETSEIEPEKVRQTFITNLTIDGSGKRTKANMSIWNGPIHPWNVDYLTIDENMKPHGYCVFNLPIEYFNSTGRHEFLNWSLKTISGKFIHGKLDGIGKSNYCFKIPSPDGACLQVS